MEEYFYRFRPVKKLIDSEIENLSIYFATPEQLNDPLEGHKDIYWQGDEIVWKNLFRHYIRCLVFKYHEMTIDEHTTEIPSALDWSHLSSELREVEALATKLFIEDVITKKYITALAQRKNKIYEGELQTYLNTCHHLALFCCQKAFIHFKVITTDLTQSENFEKERISSLSSFLHIIEMLPMAEPEEVKKVFELMSFTAAQINLIEYMKVKIDKSNKLKAANFLRFYFTNSYVKSLEKLMHPDWYVACFMSECSNSSIWGTYGENHKGACLKYKFATNETKYFLPLIKPESFPDYQQDFNLELNKVSYNSKALEYGFFESIANIPQRMSLQDWYTDGDQITPIKEWMEKFSVDKFNNALNLSATGKLEAWKHENEHRLILTSYANISQPKHRVLSYSFDNLEGVIFGIKTSDEDKTALIEKFSHHIKRTKRTDFNFYQAYFDRPSNTIQYKAMDILNKNLSVQAKI